MAEKHECQCEKNDQKVTPKLAEKANKPVDIYRDTPVRLLGYANEVGEAFRVWVRVNWVRFSYVIATGYVITDTYDKSSKMYHQEWPNSSVRQQKVTSAAIDTLCWQGLASVIIPGFTINRICSATGWFLRKRSRLPLSLQKFVTTAAGLGCIPFIVHPIDEGVDWLMDSTLRKYVFSEDISKKKPLTDLKNGKEGVVETKKT